MASHLPQDFENYMKSSLGAEFHEFVAALELPSPVSIRLNPVKAKVLEGDAVPWCSNGRYLNERPSFTLDPEFHGGRYYVQEASSMFLEQGVRQSVDLSRSLNVLDLCAAPGGKTTHLLSLISNESLLVSNEVIRGRVGALVENIQKWGSENVIVTNSDPQHFQNLPGFFDLIVVDAPCSGEGLFRKEPDARDNWSSKHVDLCTQRQRRIIADVWPALRPGGILIYSTCTYNKNENIENLVWLHAQLDLDFIKLKVDEKWRIGEVESGPAVGYQLFPHRVKGEGFFMSVMRKGGNESLRLKAKPTIQSPEKNTIREITPWLLDPDRQQYFLHNQTVRIFPTVKREALEIVLNRLHVVSAGTPVAEVMRNKLIPNHAFALSAHINKDHFNCLSVSNAQAIDYLKKNPFDLDPESTGFALIEYSGLPLGWVNILQGRFNNLYPSGWRIRMA